MTLACRLTRLLPAFAQGTGKDTRGGGCPAWRRAVCLARNSCKHLKWDRWKAGQSYSRRQDKKECISVARKLVRYQQDPPKAQALQDRKRLPRSQWTLLRGSHTSRPQASLCLDLTQMLLGKWAALVAVMMEATAAFPSSLLIEEEYASITRNCSGSPGEPVQWKHNGEALEDSGGELVIHNLDIPYAGNYSCWAGARLLQSFHVVLRGDHNYFFQAEGRKKELPITCWAPSYNGTLNCSWKSQKPATFLVHLKHRDTEAELCSTEVALPEKGMVQIQLNKCSFCSHTEEAPVTPLVLVLKGLSEDGRRYNEVNKTFLLRDVVKPDAPAYLNITGRKVSWAPPASWDLPTTYFPLRYSLRLESASGNQENFLLAEKELITEEKWHKAQIRCQDPLINSSWSSWQEWKK